MHENVRAWIEALRSGEYQQARETLRVNDEYCCLGVACDISGLHQWERLDETSIYTYDEHHNILPLTVIAWMELDIHENWGSLQGDRSGDRGLLLDLITMNDSGASFEEIADHIEIYFKERYR